MVGEVLNERDIPGFILEAVKSVGNIQTATRKDIAMGAMRGLRERGLHLSILENVKGSLSNADFIHLLLQAPFERSTWDVVNALDNELINSYWNEVSPDLMRDSPEENNEAIERLLEVGRPRAAFAAVRYDLETIRPELLYRLMSEIVKENKDKPERYQLDQYNVEQAFALMDKDPGLTLEQKAALEFAYIDALSQPWNKGDGRGIPNLEKYVEEHPELFVQAIVWTYKRKDEDEDPLEWKIPPEQVQHFAERGNKLLDGLNRIPGHDYLGELKPNLLLAWINNVRSSCAELGRPDVADLCIGKLLSTAPVGKDGVWPSEPVRDVLEEVHSIKILDGAHNGLYNARGVHFRGEGGGQERELADKYRTWANALQYTHPFLSSHLLMEMVKTYEHEAKREDTEAGINRRLK